MSYVRFGKDSDIYLYASIYGGVDCCGCALGENRSGVNLTTSAELTQHLAVHEKAGHSCGHYTWAGLISDIVNDDVFEFPLPEPPEEPCEIPL